MNIDIYLFRDGKEFGPFSEETTQSFLQRGTITMEDLAWTPGLPAWSPLAQILYPPAAQEEPQEESEIVETFHEESMQVVVETEPADIPAGESPTAKQKAFLSYMGIAFSAATTKEAAAVLVNEAMEDPRLNARVLQWNDDRLRLHPDIFAAEAQAKKDDRANRFFDVCQREGSEIFTEVTKAHCQVLVGYLDVNYPNWDAHEAEAARSYFFPAVAEKFPQLVHKEWRDELKYPTGPRVAPDLVKRSPSTRLYTAPSPIAALIRGAVFGLALLLALYVGVQIFTDDPVEETAPVAKVKSPPAPPVEPPKTVAQPAPETAPTPVAGTEPAPPEMAASIEPAATIPATPAAPKTHVIITKPIDVKLRFGSAKISAGTQFKIVSQDGAKVTVIYGAETVTIPAENTDLHAPLPAP